MFIRPVVRFMYLGEMCTAVMRLVVSRMMLVLAGLILRYWADRVGRGVCMMGRICFRGLFGRGTVLGRLCSLGGAIVGLSFLDVGRF